MSRYIASFIASTIGSLMLAGSASISSAFCQSAATLLFVHGIQGQDVNSSCAPTLPVVVNGLYPQAGLILSNFGDILGPFPAYTKEKISIYEASCSSFTIDLQSKVIFAPGSQLAAVFAEGTNGAPIVNVFDLTEGTAIPAGSARVVIFHSANAPAVDITLTENGTGTVTTLSDIMPGARMAGNILPFTGYSVRVFQAGTTNQLAGPIGLTAANRANAALFLVGNATNSTVTILTKEIHGIL